MPNQHKDLIGDDIHVFVAATYEDLAVRDADTNFHLLSNVDKIVRVDSPLGYFALSGISPTTWSELANLTGGTGDVSGPTSVVDNALARFDGTTGKIIESSLVYLSDLGVLAGMTEIGLGVAVPLLQLHVNTDALIGSGPTSGSQDGKLEISGSGSHISIVKRGMINWPTETIAGDRWSIDNINGNLGFWTEVVGNRILIQSNGKIGIGTDSPAEHVEIQDDNAITTLQINNKSTVFGVAALAFALDDTKIYTMGVDQANGKFKLGTTAIDSNTRLTIDSAGNVGIATSNPSAQLEVAGQVKITGGVPGAGKVLTGDESGLATWETPLGGGDFSDEGEAEGAARTLGNTDDFDLGFLANNTTRLHLKNNGNIGIGTTNPAEHVEVEDAGSATIVQINNTSGVFGMAGVAFAISGTKKFTMGVDDADSKFKIGTTAVNTTTRFAIDDDGNIGIGTSTFNAVAKGALAIGNGTAPGAGSANASYIYAKDVDGLSEMHVKNEAGNETQISGIFPPGYEIVKLNGTTNANNQTIISYTEATGKFIMGFSVIIHSIGLAWIPNNYGDRVDQSALYYEANWSSNSNQFNLSEVGTSLQNRPFRILVYLSK